MNNDELRAASGSIKSEDRLVTLLYLLCRDYMTVGDVESLVRLAEETHAGRVGTTYTNGYLANYAKCLVGRIRP